MKNKIVSPAEAVAIIRDGDTIACSGFVGSGTPDELINALEKRFIDTASPRDLTLVFAAGPGDGKERGLNRLARDGMVKRAIGGHWAPADHTEQRKDYLAFISATVVSSIRLLKPHSLSYQDDTFTRRPDTLVSVASKFDEAGLWL